MTAIAHASIPADNPRQAEFTPGNVQTPEERSKQVFRIRVTLKDGSDVLRAGMSAEERIVVGPSNRIVFADERMPAVLSTPWLVAHLEYAARNAIAPCLTEDERSVGSFLEVEHLAPVPEGLTVTCRARVITSDGPVVTFQVEAHDGLKHVARGLHRRRVIDVDRFARRVARKREARRSSGL